MNIEIVTTKKKLTKSLINQMPDGMDFKILEKCMVLGFITGIRNNAIVLVHYNGEYYVIDANWKKSTPTTLSRKTAKFSRKFGYLQRKKEFKDESSCYAIWEAYKIVLGKAPEHIYI